MVIEQIHFEQQSSNLLIRNTDEKITMDLTAFIVRATIQTRLHYSFMDKLSSVWPRLLARFTSDINSPR